MSKIAEIIKYEGNNDTFIWKHPCEDFNSMTQLIVHESQEAVFFMNGQALDLFGAGRHTLQTQNIPMIGKIFNRTTGGDTPFHCEVYFINKTVQMALKWGTDSRVRFLEPNYGIPLDIGACGEMELAVSDSRKLLVKLVGTTSGIQWSGGDKSFTQSLVNSFRPLISSSVKSSLASTIKKNNINILEIDEQLGLLSSALKESIIDGFEEYGLTIPNFYVTNVVLPEDDIEFRRLKDLYTTSFRTKIIDAETTIKLSQAQADAAVVEKQRITEMQRQTTETEVAKAKAERELIEAQAKAQAARIAGFAEADVMHAKGYDQRDVLQADVQKAYAAGIGNMTINGGGAGDIVGLGVGMAAAGAISPKLGEMFGGINGGENKSENKKCAACGADIPKKAKFCPMCGGMAEELGADEMICPACGEKTQKGKFCMLCGAALVKNCPSCGAELPDGAKFCLQCGCKL